MNNSIILRNFHLSNSYLKKLQPNNLKGKSKSSQEWLTRQLNDDYVAKAKLENYRCRSAFKLIEIDDKNQILKPGYKVIDVGASPGSWTQVAIPRINADGHNLKLPIGSILSIDLQPIYPINGATILGNIDFTKLVSQKMIKDHLGNQLAQVILSDMAPKATGISHLDQENIINLAYSVLRFAVEVSEPDIGVMLVKLWACGQQKQFENDVNRFYKKIKLIKPLASRSDSAELFLLATGFKGLSSR